LTAAEIKEGVPIEMAIAYYGGRLNAKGQGRCLRSEDHPYGDRHPSMRVRRGRVRCWSQGCFGPKGADIFALVGIMENLTAFAEQKRRVLEIAGLTDVPLSRRPSTIQPRPWRFDWRRVSADLQDYALALSLRAESIFQKATGLDSSEWTDAETEIAMMALAKAFRGLERSEFLEDVAFNLRLRGLEKEKERDATRS
jgi:hypothetical protein